MSTAETTTLCARELRALCGAEHVVEDPAALGRLQILGVVPSVAVSPGSAEEIAAVLRLANKHTLSVVPAGGFTQPRIGNVPVQTDILLETSRLTGIELPDDVAVMVSAWYGGWKPGRPCMPPARAMRI